MKNIITIAFLFSSIICFGQSLPITDKFPVKQAVGNSDSTVLITNAIRPRAGVINAVYNDTLSANNGRLYQYAGSQIFVITTNSLWLRNATNTAWLEMANSLVTSGNIAVANVAALRTFTGGSTSPLARIINTSKQYVFTSGYYSEGDGGNSTYVWNDTSTHADDGGGYILPTGYVGVGRWQLLPELGTVNVKQFGLKPEYVNAISTGVDNRPLFISLLNYIKGRTSAFYNFSKYKIFFPAMSDVKSYYFSDSVVVDVGCEIYGQGNVANTILQWPAGKGGFVIKSPNTSISGDMGSIWAYIHDIQFYGGNPTIGSGKNIYADGIKIYSPTQLERIDVTRFAGSGIKFYGAAPGSNCNTSLLINVRSSNNREHGFSFDGPDANAISILHCSAVINDEWGFYESSFLGNYIIDPHTATNAYYTTNTYVSYDSVWYAANLANVNVKPGIDSLWETYWRVMQDGLPNAEVLEWDSTKNYVGGGSIILDNVNNKGGLLFPYQESDQGPMLNIGSALILNGQGTANGNVRNTITAGPDGIAVYGLQTPFATDNIQFQVNKNVSSFGNYDFDNNIHVGFNYNKTHKWLTSETNQIPGSFIITSSITPAASVGRSNSPGVGTATISTEMLFNSLGNHYSKFGMRQVIPTIGNYEVGDFLLYYPSSSGSKLLGFRSATSGAPGTFDSLYGHISLINSDDHLQYALLAGRAGGQLLYGGVDANDNLTLNSTSNATKGYLNLQTGGGLVGIGTAIPNPSAVLDITSTTKGVLFPRLTTAQQDAISSPASGLIIWNVDSSLFRYFNGAAWTSLAAGSGGGGGGAGTVTSFAFTDGGGFDGTVTGATTNVNLSIIPSFTGWAYSNGSALAAGSFTSPLINTTGTLSLAGLTGLGTANQILGMNSGATAYEYKTLSVGTSGTDFAIAHSTGGVAVNLPDAGISSRGAVTTGPQVFGGVKTLTSPRIGASIDDINGNELFILTATSSAVNEITLANASIGTNPKFIASGSDSNIGLDFLGKGTGNIRILGNSTQAGTLQLFEDTDNGTNFFSLKAGAMASDDAYVWPVSRPPVNGYVLSSLTDGTLSWVVQSGGGGSTALSSITDALAGNVINNFNFAQSWGWSTLSSGIGMTFSSNSTAAASNMQELVRFHLLGDNANASQTTVTAKFFNTHTGTTPVNIASQFSAINGSTNYAAQFLRGIVSIGTAGTETGQLQINSIGGGTTTFSVPSSALSPTFVLPTVSGTIPQYVETSITSSAAPTPTGNARVNWLYITALTTNPTFAAPSGTYSNGNQIIIRVTASGGSRSLAFNPIYEGSADISLPTLVADGTDTYMNFFYNSATNRFQMSGLTQGF